MQMPSFILSWFTAPNYIPYCNRFLGHRDHRFNPAIMSKYFRGRGDVDEAHDLQIRAGLKVSFPILIVSDFTDSHNGYSWQGAAQFTAIGLGAVTLAHHSYPLFR